MYRVAERRDQREGWATEGIGGGKEGSGSARAAGALGQQEC